MATNGIKSISLDSTNYLIEPVLYANAEWAKNSAGTAYVASLPNFELFTGVTINAKFQGNNAAGATLNVNSTGAKTIKFSGNDVKEDGLLADHIYSLIYDGTYWQLFTNPDDRNVEVTNLDAVELVRAVTFIEGGNGEQFIGSYAALDNLGNVSCTGHVFAGVNNSTGQDAAVTLDSAGALDGSGGRISLRPATTGNNTAIIEMRYDSGDRLYFRPDNGWGVYLDLANGVFNAGTSNDFAEYRQCAPLLQPGQCVQENDNGIMTSTAARLVPGASIISDTYGFIQGETLFAKTPIAVAGRVLAYPFQDRKNYHAGMAVCSAPNGKVDIMSREEIQQYPDCIVGYVSEVPTYEYWGVNNRVKVDGRIWIKIK